MIMGEYVTPDPDSLLSASDKALRERDIRLGTNAPVAVPVLPPVDYTMGLSKDISEAQSSQAQRQEINAEKGSSFTRILNEPVLEVMRATPVLNYLAPAYSPSSATPYADGGAGGGSSRAGVVTADVPPPGKQATAMTDQEKQLEVLRAQIMGMGGGPSVGMNKYIKRGFEGQQAALGEQIGAIQAGEPEMEAARAGMQAVGQGYIGGLKKLGAQRQELHDARRGAMAEEARRLAGEEKTFDASRVLRNVGDSPVGTAALSFAAGLVGALKGAAGDMSPNQILGEVDKAVQRDVDNQREQYSRMLQGQSTARTHFLDARQMGADDGQALATSTLASMDQHKRALEFAEKRVAGNREKASLKGAIHVLDGQRGKMQMDLDLKNAAAAGAMARAKVEALVKLREGLSPEDQAKLATAYGVASTEKGWVASSEQLQSVAKMRKFQGRIPVERQKVLWETGLGRVLREAVTKVSGQKDAGVAAQAIAQYVSNEMKSGMSQDQRDMVALAQEIVNNRLRQISGGSVVSDENVRDVLSHDLASYEGFKGWMDYNEEKSMAGINRGLIVGRASPILAGMLESSVAPWIAENKQYHVGLSDTAELQSSAGAK